VIHHGVRPGAIAAAYARRPLTRIVLGSGRLVAVTASVAANSDHRPPVA
jgi:hypothetical protein